MAAARGEQPSIAAVWVRKKRGKVGKVGIEFESLEPRWLPAILIRIAIGHDRIATAKATRETTWG
jgi:hypothetical protein